MLKNTTTEVGGLLKSSLQTKNERCFREYHPRQWVDCLGPAYRRRTSAASGNTTHGKWVDCSRPAYRRRTSDASGIPPTEVGALFKASLQTKNERCFREYHPREVGGSFKASLQAKNERCFREYHPRKWVDCSRPAYRKKNERCFREYHSRKWVDCSRQAYRRRTSVASGNITTAVLLFL